MYQQSLNSFGDTSASVTSSPVSVHTEWDPLEEVIVGTANAARFPDWHSSIEAVVPRRNRRLFAQQSGKPFPQEVIKLAEYELDNLCDFLIRDGVTVRRPDRSTTSEPYQTPCFKSSGNMYAAMPRDGFLAIGDQIIETPMAWRNRYFEAIPYREILKNYSRRGARWVSAPKPTLSDDLYKKDHDPNGDTFESIVSEFEPVFDGADFFRMGTDIIGQLSHVTNWFGVDWLQRHLGSEYKIHIFAFDDSSPMHIDTTILPMAPGKVLVNREWVSKIPNIFKDWEILVPPASVLSVHHPLYFTSKWISVNILMLDNHRVLVESDEEPLIEALRSWGFDPIPLPFKNFQTLGGSFHCATLDVRRAGTRKSYV